MLRLNTQIFVVFLFCVVASVASAALTDGLISAWTFEGDNVNDLMGNANGTLVGGAGYSDGIHGRALDVNGVDAYAEIPHHPSMDAMEQAFTHAVRAFIRASGDHGGIMFKGEKVGWGPHFHIRLITTGDTNLSFGSNNILGAVDGEQEPDAHNAEGWLNADVSYELGTWIHMAQVANGQTLQAFLNGAPADITWGFHHRSGTEPVTLTAPYAVFPDHSIYLGTSRGHGGEVDNYKFIDGMIDDVALFDRALSADEIAELANTNLATVTSVEAKAKLATTWARLKTH